MVAGEGFGKTGPKHTWGVPSLAGLPHPATCKAAVLARFVLRQSAQVSPRTYVKLARRGMEPIW